MTSDRFDQLLTRLAAGWTAADYESVASHFAENVFYSDSNSYTIRDRVTLLEFFRDDDGLSQSCIFHNSCFDEVRQVGVAEYTYSGTNQYHGTVWIDIRDDKIARWREYQHKTQVPFTDFWK